MKITLKSECVANDRAFKDCTVGAIYEAEFCENPLVKALLEEGPLYHKKRSMSWKTQHSALPLKMMKETLSGALLMK